MTARRFVVAFDSRHFAIQAEGRPVGVTVTITTGFGTMRFATEPFGGAGATRTVPPATRGWAVPFDGRHLAVESEHRSLAVPAERRTLGA